MVKCIVCGEKNNKKAVFQEQGIAILCCGQCGHVYSAYDAAPDNADYFGGDIASTDHYWWREAHARMYEDFGRKFLRNRSKPPDTAGRPSTPAGRRLLDIGCGLGYFAAFAGKHPGWEAYGSEISAPAAEFAREKLGLKNIFSGRTEDAGYRERSFDIITLWDVIEHIPDPHSLLKYLFGILKDDGFLFLHTPNINIQLPKARIKKAFVGDKPGAHYLEARDHLNDYSTRTLTAVLRTNGFNSVNFVHLPPIQSAAGSRSAILRAMKNGWYHIARTLDFITFGRINADNLFAIARKY